MQHRVFGEIQQDCESVALAAAEHDQIYLLLLRHADDLRLYVTCLNEALAATQPEGSGELLEADAGTLDELLFDLHRGQQGLPHRLHRNVLDHVQQLDGGLITGRDGLRPLADDFAVLSEIHDKENLAVFVHDGLRHWAGPIIAGTRWQFLRRPTTRRSARTAAARVSPDASRGRFPAAAAVLRSPFP